MTHAGRPAAGPLGRWAGGKSPQAAGLATRGLARRLPPPSASPSLASRACVPSLASYPPVAAASLLLRDLPFRSRVPRASLATALPVRDPKRHEHKNRNIYVLKQTKSKLKYVHGRSNTINRHK